MIALFTSPRAVFDFLTGSIDPRISFARAGATSTRFNSAGDLEIVAADTPRINYDPATRRCRGLLVEETRVNYVANNQMQGAVVGSPGSTPTGWVGRTGATAVSSEIVAVGTEAGIPYIDVRFFGTPSSTAPQTLRAGGSTTVTAGTIWTVSAWLKISAGSLTNVSGFTLRVADETVGTIFTPTASFTRITNTRTLVGTARNWTLRWNYSNTTTAVDFTLRVGMPQLEEGASVSSVIPTDNTAGGVTRNADAATVTGANFSGFWRAGAGGVLVRASQNIVTGTRPWVRFDDDTANNIIALRGNTTNPELYIKATTDQAQIDAGTIAASTSYRFAGTWATNNCAASLNGAVPVGDTSATVPTATQMRIGSDGTNYLNGHIESIEYYDRRILNANLQLVSSPTGYRSIIGPVIQDTIIS